MQAIITERHWTGMESIRAIERSLDMSNGLLSKWCIKHGIAVRPKAAQVAIVMRSTPRPSGETHWAWGLRKETDPRIAKHSERMQARNPMASATLREKASASYAEHVRKNPGMKEALVLGFLSQCGVPHVFQHIVGAYILDFAFPHYRVALEIDGKEHNRPERRAHDLERDGWLVERGWKIIRVRNRNVSQPLVWLVVLKQHVPDLQIPSGLPPIRRQYWMLVRDAESPAGRKVYATNPRTRRRLAHDGVDAAPAAAVRQR